MRRMPASDTCVQAGDLLCSTQYERSCNSFSIMSGQLALSDGGAWLVGWNPPSAHDQLLFNHFSGRVSYGRAERHRLGPLPF